MTDINKDKKYTWTLKVYGANDVIHAVDEKSHICPVEEGSFIMTTEDANKEAERRSKGINFWLCSKEGDTVFHLKNN